jgi:hypothetical protein
MAIAIPRVIARNITLTIDGVDYAPQVNMVELTLGDAPGGTQSFTEVRPDGEWAMSIEAYYSQDADSLNRLLFAEFGNEILFVINPGGGTIGADNPAYTGTLIVNELPPLSLTSNEEVSFSVTLRVKNTGLDTAAKLYYGLTIDVTP